MAKNHRIVALLVAVTLVAQLAPAAACAYCPTPTPSPPPPPSTPTTYPTPPSTPTTYPTPPSTPTTYPTPPTTPTTGKKCPVDTLKLLACVDALGGLVHAVIGAKASEMCCPLLSGVADLDAALCLCTTIQAKALDVTLVLPIALQVLVNECHKDVPANFQCPY